MEAYVKNHPLTDGSLVYNVRVVTDTDVPEIILGCTSEQSAAELLRAIETCVVDVDVKEGSPS